MEKRICKTCGTERSIDEFRLHVKKGREYREYECIPCGRARALARYHANRDEFCAIAREKYAKDPASHIEKVKRWYVNNRKRAIKRSAANRAKKIEQYREREKRSSVLWRKKNLEASRLLSKKGRAKKKSAKIGVIRKEDLRALLERQGNKCACCSAHLEKKHLDHVVPLYLGGAHEILNFQYLCPRCNLSKSKKHPIDFMQTRGFLL